MAFVETVSAISTAVKAVGVVKDVINSLKGSVDAQRLQEVTESLITINSTIIDLQQKFSEQEMELQRIRATLDAGNQYVLVNVGNGSVLIERGKEGSLADPEYVFSYQAQFFCQYCAQEKRFIALTRGGVRGGFYLWCDHCKREVVVKESRSSF